MTNHGALYFIWVGLILATTPTPLHSLIVCFPMANTSLVAERTPGQARGQINVTQYAKTHGGGMWTPPPQTGSQTPRQAKVFLVQHLVQHRNFLFPGCGQNRSPNWTNWPKKAEP